MHLGCCLLQEYLLPVYKALDGDNKPRKPTEAGKYDHLQQHIVFKPTYTMYLHFCHNTQY